MRKIESHEAYLALGKQRESVRSQLHYHLRNLVGGRHPNGQSSSPVLGVASSLITIKSLLDSYDELDAAIKGLQS